MEHSTPIAIAVQGHPDIESIALSWSAEGMVPQAARFDAKGGIAQAIVTQSKPESICIQYCAKVTFRFPGWGILELAGEAAVSTEAIAAVASRPGNAAVTLCPGAWIRYLTFQIQAEEPQPEAATAQYSSQSQDCLVVNLSWKSPADFKWAAKASHRLTPHAPVQFAYLQNPNSPHTSATLSGFGVIAGKLTQLTEIAIKLDKDFILLRATQGTVQVT
ncbi:MAG: hypothetical protein WBA10_03855 [Elainellaceae cyanobacterium]